MTLGDTAYFFSIHPISISLQWVLSEPGLGPGFWGICSIRSREFLCIHDVPKPRARAIGWSLMLWTITPTEADPKYFWYIQPT